MHNHPPITRLAIAFCKWLLAGCGLEFTPVPRGAASALFYRDPRGRFVSLSKLPPPDAANPPSGQPGAVEYPAAVPEPVAEVLYDIGVTPDMYRTAAVPLELPDDLEDVPAVERALRHWIYRNMDHWVNGQGRSVWTVMRTLMHTWAITRYYYKPPRRRNSHRQDASSTVRAELASAHSGASTSEAYPTQEEPTTKHTKDTKGTKFEPQHEPNAEPQTLRDLRVLRVLRGESPSADTSTIAGGVELRPYVDFWRSPESARGDPLRGPPDYPSHHRTLKI